MRRIGAIIFIVATVVAGLAGSAVAQQQPPLLRVYSSPLVRTLVFNYRAWDGALRPAYLMLPASYGPNNNPPIPLVISPHGRGVDPRINELYWGDLPGRGNFAVINPSEEGRRLGLYSWGAPGAINDLARMPDLIRQAFPWIRFDLHRIYAAGSSMGGQETLLLVARHPGLLAGAAALDSATDMELRYQAFPGLRDGLALQQLLVNEIGGTPGSVPAAYDARSPSSFVRQLAFSGVPLQIWWSTADRIVADQPSESGKLYTDILRANPVAAVTQTIGSWAHSCELASAFPIAVAKWGIVLTPPLPNATPPSASLC